ncbi:UDP-N-acetylmuramoyl-tripeptide--D-alanyl-D-alanine ligase family protein [Neorickettsia helminthoeca str. Oregon]|uniref:UDP-N-acetylmuramoyl-tripeptide--D-alanyl-D-alanine ligase n=1 Tax=Neorickettsia helminthoeca str. Oregon TaxID=1286528 RepID=X5H4A2_9RICK|nr:UDP-N-acetylmuramoyl-tripeptide--D-alanyl-D-alanine ligase [Neorickettsia helminthoeca]AHX11396.1 UDP-N-acetylmuramoyl-tripeptide--D-alanyl-D-alanine ligase family protein [Neorickettsia helminthoeca str. Oregon]
MILTPNLIRSVLKAEVISKYDVRIDISKSRFSIDSRTIEKGEIFIAIKGERCDAHTFIESAYLNGASAIITRKHLECPELAIPIIKVDDPVAAMQKLATMLIREYQPIVIGITGSNGKTTSKEFTAALLRNYGETHCNAGNLNSLIGLPLSVLNTDFPCKFLVLEMGMLHHGDIDLLNRIALPKVTIITNIGSAHIKFLGSQEAIALEKAKIFQNGCPVVLNPNAPYSDLLIERAKESNSTILSFGEGKDCDIKLLDYSNSRVSIEIYGARYTYQFPNYGLHFVYDSLAAIGVAKALELDITNELLENTFSTFQPSKGRGEHHNFSIDGKKITVIDDTYNANYESISALIKYVQSTYSDMRVITIIGSIGDMGERAEEFYRKLAERVGSLESLILIGTDKISILKESLANSVALYADVDELINNFYRDHPLTQDTVIAIKGSRFMNLEKFVQHIIAKADQLLPLESIS